MFYYVLKVLVYIAMRLYFDHIEKKGLSHIDNGRPTLILANHTNSFMDAIIMGTVLRRRIHFFTRGDVFEKSWANKFLRSINLLPVYRINEGKDNLYRNDASNEEALAILKKGGSVIIFAEGQSDTVKILKPLKKGPFRLAVLGAAQLDQAPLIVPLGINYTEPTRPFTNLYLYAGAVTDTALFKTKDPAGQSKAALQMLRQVSEDIRPLVWHVAQPELAGIADGLLCLQQERYRKPSFEHTQRLIGRLNDLDPVDAATLTEQWELFVALRKKICPGALHLTRALFPKALFVLLAAAPAFAGWLFHILPVRLSRIITNRKVKSPDFLASVFMSLAIVLILTWYLLFFTGAALIFNGWIALWIVLAIALAGVFYLKAYRHPLIAVKSFLQRHRAERRYPAEWAELTSLYGCLLPFLD